MNRTELGRWGEEQAAAYLEECGYALLQRNFRCRLGEIDIVALRDGVLCFVEVKTRSSLDFGLPCQAVGADKQERLRRAAQIYVQRNAVSHRQDLRMDVIEILRLPQGSYIRHVEGAF